MGGYQLIDFAGASRGIHIRVPCRLSALAVFLAVKIESAASLEIITILIGQRVQEGLPHLLLGLGDELRVDFNLWGGKSRSSDEFLKCIVSKKSRDTSEADQKAGTHEALVSDELSGEPQEGLLKVVVGLGGDVVVLEVLLAVEGDGLGLHLALLDIDLVTAKDNGDVFANTDKVTCRVESASQTNHSSRVLVVEGRGDSYGATRGRSCR